MAKKTVESTPVAPVVDTSAALVSALVQAIEATKPVQKKNASNRKIVTPWTPKDGSPKLKLKRKMFQHGLAIDPDMIYNEDIEALNQLKPGRFLDGWVSIVRRRDKGIDIVYPMKTASQRLKLVNQFGIRNFRELILRCVEEANNPVKYAVQDLD
jgi:hypothetical protein